MELKYERCVVDVFCFHLLIVLNGIEIFLPVAVLSGAFLLIVLNGIEIHLLQFLLAYPSLLLIVLNGIEICIQIRNFYLLFLLIVLNGIEIRARQ